jgi:hypothetical protein
MFLPDPAESFEIPWFTGVKVLSFFQPDPTVFEMTLLRRQENSPEAPFSPIPQYA